LKEILHLNKIGIEDNFFEIGVDSISSIKILSKIIEIFSIIKQFFENSKDFKIIKIN
jgi:hypothetical protein